MTRPIPRLLAVVLVLGSFACPARTPQTPDLTTTPATGTGAAAEKPMREVVELQPGEDPFRNLPAPVVSSDSKYAETLRLGPVARPLPGETVAAWPPPGSLPRPSAMPAELPVEVVRTQPEGKIETAGAVVVAFNQPVVPLASVGELKEVTPPLVIEPAMKGRFRWLDTQTLVFEAEPRIPYGNGFTAKVAAGAALPGGKVVAKGADWKFETPAPAVSHQLPGDQTTGVTLDTSVALQFNADVDPASAKPWIRWKTKAGVPVLFDVEQVVSTGGADEVIQSKRRLTLKAKAPLSKATDYVVEVARELKSSEGPRSMERAWSSSFRTYDPLKVNDVACNGWQPEGKPCSPLAGFRIEFNNGLKPQKISEFVEFAPKVEGLAIQHWGSTLSLSGEFQASTKYTLTVKAAITDQFGQTLGQPYTKALVTGALDPMLTIAEGQGTLVLESKFAPALPVIATNVPKATLKLSRIEPSRAFELIHVEEQGQYRPTERSVFTQLRLTPDVTRELVPSPANDVIDRFGIDLAPVLKNGKGWAVLELDAPALRHNPDWSWEPTLRSVFVQVTDLGLTAATSAEEIHVLVLRLSDNTPATGASVALFDSTGKQVATAPTDGQGLARLPGPFTSGVKGAYALVATLGDDAAFLPLTSNALVGGNVPQYWGSDVQRDKELVVGQAFTERGVYRPDETVHVKVIARFRSIGPDGDVLAGARIAGKTSWFIRGPQWDEVASGMAEFDAFGTLSFDWTPPKDVKLGDFHAYVNVKGQQLAADFSIQEFRTPEFVVDVTHVGEGPLVLGGKTAVRIGGRYLFGAPMADTAVQWRVNRKSTGYTPPGNDGFTFASGGGFWGPHPFGRGKMGFDRYDGGEETASGTATLDSQGRATLAIELPPPSDTRPANFTLEAEVTDRNRQVVAGRTTLLAHRALVYAGLRVEKGVVKAGEPVRVDALVVGVDGKRLAGTPFKVEFVERVQETVVGEDGGERQETKEIVAQSCDLVMGTEFVKCELATKRAGHHFVRVTAKDAAGHDSLATQDVWVHDPAQRPWFDPKAAVKVDLVPDRTAYAADDTARVLVNSPFADARGFLLLSREGFAEVRPLVVKGGSLLAEVKLRERWAPQVKLTVVLARGRIEAPPESGDDAGLPKFASGELELPIDRERRRVVVDVKPDRTAVSPGSTIDIAVSTRDAQGKPLAANVALMVVDEGVLSLTAYATPNPLEALYQPLDPQTGASDLRPNVMGRDRQPLKLADAGAGAKETTGALRKMSARGMGGGGPVPAPAPMAAMAMDRMAEMPADGGGGGAPAGPAFAVRELFKSTAFFDGSVHTDATGTAHVKVKLPDNLTQFRIMAVAADDARRFGSGDSQVTVRLPILVRPSLPRFLNLGDTFEASAVVNNETGVDTDALVKVVTVNATVAAPEQRITMKAGASQEVRFSAKAGNPGPAAFQFAVVALTKDRPTDAAIVTLPTLIPATSEAFATYGSTEKSVLQPLSVPKDVLPGFGGLEVQLTSTALTGLQDAASYLVEYPYECAEQTASRLVPLVALKEILGSFGIGDEKQRAQLVANAIDRLATLQQADGGFAFWPGGRTWLHVGAWATFALQSARDAGEKVPDEMLNRALDFVANRLKSPVDEWERKDDATRSLAVLVLTRAGRTAEPFLATLTTSKSLPQFAKAWLLAAHTFAKTPAKAAELRRQLDNAMVETAGTLHIADSVTEHLRLLMHSDDRTDAIVLWALLVADPKAPQVEKLQRGLMKSRIRGRWSTTQSNAWALLAMKQYFTLYEATEPAFDARVWAGESYAGGRRFEGRTLDVYSSKVPMAELVAKPPEDVLVSKEGPGRLYYRLGLRYAPASLSVKAEEQGFVVSRLYEGLDDPKAVTKREDGTWVVKAGANVRVTLTVVVPDRRHYVAVVDPMPAGFEGLNASFATTASRVGAVEGEREDSPSWMRWWHWSPWDHTELRDDQARAFADRMSAGVFTHKYVARATGLGSFVVPPARAEEMYAAETFGRSGSDRVEVVP